MSLILNIGKMQRMSSVYKSSVSWTRAMSSSTPAPTKPDVPKPAAAPSDSHTGGSRATHRPDNLEKRFLVWTGKYKSVDEIPAYINQETMERTRNKIRIRGANIMIVLTIFGCIYAVYSGKKAAESGESVAKLNADWHKKYNQDTSTSK